MKHYKMETQEQEVFVKATCDKCNKDVEIENPGYGDPNDGDCNNFNLEWSKSSIWDGPEFSITVDLCFACREWLFDFLSDSGVELQRSDGKLHL